MREEEQRLIYTSVPQGASGCPTSGERRAGGWTLVRREDACSYRVAWDVGLRERHVFRSVGPS